MNSPTKRPLNPQRQRQVPAHFSWLDHRLVREHYIEKADVCAWALYLFLVTVADAWLVWMSMVSPTPAPPRSLPELIARMP